MIIARLLAILLLLWFPCVSQSERRIVTGVVTDKRGNALPGAAVELEDTHSLLIVSYITDKQGRYHFSQLFGDVDYTLKAKYRSYWSKEKRLSKFNSAKRAEIDLVIPIE